MKRAAIIISLLIATSATPSLAIETAPGITDREIVERLTRVETKLDSVDKRLDSVENGINQLRKDMNTMGKQLREDMNTMGKQLREDMNTQFNRLAAIFTALVVSIIGFAIWDRRTMIRPFETRVKVIEEEIASNRTKLHSLLDALRTLSRSDEKVGAVLKRFNLL